MEFYDKEVHLSDHCLDRASKRFKKLLKKSGYPIGDIWLKDKAHDALRFGWGKEVTTDGFMMNLDIEHVTVTFVFLEEKEHLLLKTIY